MQAVGDTGQQLFRPTSVRKTSRAVTTKKKKMKITPPVATEAEGMVVMEAEGMEAEVMEAEVMAVAEEVTVEEGATVEEGKFPLVIFQ